MTWFERVAERRRPDFVIGSPDAPYLMRWWILPRNHVFNIYLHHILRNDDDRALHDHPWWNLSYLLRGSYTEHVIEQGGVHQAFIRYEHSFTFRRASRAHRLELHDGPAWSLFFTGPVVRKWGFHCPAGWRPWELFVSARDKGQVGRGCE